MDENSIEVKGNPGAQSPGKHTSGRIAIASAVAIGSALASGGDVSAATSRYMDRQANIPPQTEMMTGESFSNQGVEEMSRENIYPFGISSDTGFADVGTVTEEKDGEFDGEIISPEDPRYLGLLREAIEAQGQILIESSFVPFEVVGEKGATDKHRKYYENAINKISIAGNEIEMRAGKYSDEVTFLFDRDYDGLANMVGIYWLGDKDSGKSFNASPYLEPLGGGYKVYIDSRDQGKANYGIITTIGTNGSKSVKPPEVYLDSEGNPRLLFSSPNGFQVPPSGFVESDTAWVESMLFKGFIEVDGTYVIELLGVLDGSKVSILPQYLDPETARLEGINR
jgi:hypothetical protein